MACNKVVLGTNTLIDLTTDTVTAENVASGIVFHGPDGVTYTGTNDFDSNTQDASATADEIIEGATAYVRGNKITGTMTNNGGVEGTISTVDGEYDIPVGYHDGSGTVKIDATEAAKLIPANIREGIEVLGVTGTMEAGEGITAQAKTVTASLEDQTVLPDDDYTYLSSVTVKALPVTQTSNAAGGTTVTIG